MKKLSFKQKIKLMGYMTSLSFNFIKESYATKLNGDTNSEEFKAYQNELSSFNADHGTQLSDIVDNNSDFLNQCIDSDVDLKMTELTDTNIKLEITLTK